MLPTEGAGGELGTGHPHPPMRCSAQPDKTEPFRGQILSQTVCHTGRPAGPPVLLPT